MKHAPTPASTGERRNFLQWISVGLGGLASLALGIPVVGYIAGALVHPRPDESIDLGPLSDYTIGQTKLKKFVNGLKQPWDGNSANAAVYVRRESADKFTVFSVFCAHLGCPVSWFPASGLFMCPCHGGVYYEDGSHASGPPPRGLFEYPIDEAALAKGQLRIKGGHLPTLQDTFKDPHSV